MQAVISTHPHPLLISYPSLAVLPDRPVHGHTYVPQEIKKNVSWFCCFSCAFIYWNMKTIRQGETNMQVKLEMLSSLSSLSVSTRRGLLIKPCTAAVFTLLLVCVCVCIPWESKGESLAQLHNPVNFRASVTLQRLAKVSFVMLSLSFSLSYW